MNYVTILGLIAGALTTVSFLPQVIKTWRTKATSALSLWTFILQGTALILWTIYGIMIKELPLILWNFIPACLVSMIIIFKLKYK